MLADADLARADTMTNCHMRASMERSAQAWTARSQMLGRLEASFNARVQTHASPNVQS